MQITDPAGKVQALAYGGPNGKLSLVTDQNTGKQVAFYYAGSHVAQVVDNGTVATNLTYQGDAVTGVSIVNGMTVVQSVQLTYIGGLLSTMTQDNDPATTVTLGYTPWPSKDCSTFVQLANAETPTAPNSPPRRSAIDWSQQAVNGVAASVYRTNAKGGTFRYDFGGNGDLVKVTKPTLTGASAPLVYSFTYDGGHNCTSVSDGATTVNAAYDGRGNLTSVSLGAATWSATYGGGNGVDLLTTTDPLCRGTSVAYGDNAQPHVPTAFTDELSLTWSATHNVFGQLLTAAPPPGSPTGMGSVVYDEALGSPNRGYRYTPPTATATW